MEIAPPRRPPARCGKWSQIPRGRMGNGGIAPPLRTVWEMGNPVREMGPRDFHNVTSQNHYGNAEIHYGNAENAPKSHAGAWEMDHFHNGASQFHYGNGGPQCGRGGCCPQGSGSHTDIQDIWILIDIEQSMQSTK